MPPAGVKIQEVEIGTGPQAIRGKTIVANVRVFLNHGTELTGTFMSGPRMRIDLGRRECIAGLRYGIEGMRAGGRRRLVISPHLAYGTEGVPGHIPPNAVLRCEVELLEVREAGVVSPEDYPPGKQLCVFHPGEAARNLPRWQFDLHEDGRCGAMLAYPIPGLPWRHTRHRQIESQLDQPTTTALFRNAFALPQQFPQDCLGYADLWADMTERGNSITRDKHSNSLCLTIFVDEQAQHLCHYAIAERSQALLASPLYKVISGLLEPYLATETQQH